ncbi:hypothetical protein HGH93_06985 [Chitinophaga polysaccharea]|uniref:hypothetical protein n=1 Tax=Chitinophaga TaxID=79328 RepID=UPI001454FA84|nr:MULTISPECIES: hypothetical protein [Chitinophaga]NLR57837.1 hypothetical protein [Chitinophaga polysaccharea]NLU93430.1 hypothetical protein [Chitinophaga sp. Ak27]
MKKLHIHLWLWSLLSVMILLGVSCKKKNDPSPNKETREVVFLGSFVPDMITLEKENVVVLSFKKCQGTFKFVLARVSSNMYMSFLKHARKSARPVKIYIYKGSTDIAEIK